jgi:hypothetical protein
MAESPALAMNLAMTLLMRLLGEARNAERGVSDTVELGGFGFIVGSQGCREGWPGDAPGGGEMLDFIVSNSAGSDLEAAALLKVFSIDCASP